MTDLTSCPPPKRRACVAGSVRLGAIFCVDDGNCATLRIRARETVAADCSATATIYEILDAQDAVVGVHLGGLLRVPCEALRVKLVDACTTAAGPVAALNIEFSETLLYSEASEIALMRIRRYSEATGVWTLLYENLDGTAFTGALPTDLAARSAQVNVAQTSTPSCASGVAFTKRETARFDAETGALESYVVEWVDASGAATTVAPVGVVPQPCPDPALAEIAANTLATSAAINTASTNEIAADAANATLVTAAINTASTNEIAADAANATLVTAAVNTASTNEITADAANATLVIAAINTASTNEITADSVNLGGLVSTLVALSGNEVAAANSIAFNSDTLLAGTASSIVTAINTASVNETTIAATAATDNVAGHTATTAAVQALAIDVVGISAATAALSDVEYVQVPGCAGGVYTPRLDVYLHNATSNAITPLGQQYLVAGVWQPTPPALWEAGDCPQVILTKVVSSFAAQRASGAFGATYALPPSTDSWSAAGIVGLQSVTITPVKANGPPSGANYIAVQLGPVATATTVRLTEEYPSYTWSVAQDAGNTAEVLDNQILVTAVGDAAFLVTWVATGV